MIKTYLGIEVGNRSLKLAVCEGNRIKKFVQEGIPNDIVKEGQISDWDRMTKLLKETLKKYGISCKDAAMVLPEDITYVRRVVMPYMTVEQLRFNLPYEFSDFIAEEKDEYVYDYAVMDIFEEEENGKTVKNMDIMAAAVSKTNLELYRHMLKECKLRLRIAASESSAYQNIVRKYMELNPSEREADFAVLNLGHYAVNLRIYTKGKYETGKEIKPGLQSIASIISQSEQISELEVPYLSRNDASFSKEECMAVYDQIALEVMRVISFFNYNHPGNTLDTLHCCGRGLTIRPLTETLENVVGMKIKGLQELFGDISEDNQAMVYGAAAVGITWN